MNPIVVAFIAVDVIAAAILVPLWVHTEIELRKSESRIQKIRHELKESDARTEEIYDAILNGSYDAKGNLRELPPVDPSVGEEWEVYVSHPYQGIDPTSVPEHWAINSEGEIIDLDKGEKYG